MSVVDHVAEHLAALGYAFRQVGDEYIDLHVEGDATSYRVAITGHGPIVSVIAPIILTAPPERVNEALRLASLINALRPPFGSFRVDPTERRIAFGVDLVAPDGPTRQQVRIAMRVLAAIDHCLPMFVRVLWQGMTATEALALQRRSRTDVEPPLTLIV